MVKLKVYVSIDDAIFSSFKIFCSKNGMKVSSKVEQMMRETMKDKPLSSYIK